MNGIGKRTQKTTGRVRTVFGLFHARATYEGQIGWVRSISMQSSESSCPICSKNPGGDPLKASCLCSGSALEVTGLSRGVSTILDPLPDLTFHRSRN